MKKVVKLLNEAHKSGILPIVLGGLVSADCLTSIDACNKSIELLTEFAEALPETNIEEKETYEKLIKKGISIAEEDKKKLENK